MANLRCPADSLQLSGLHLADNDFRITSALLYSTELGGSKNSDAFLIVARFIFKYYLAIDSTIVPGVPVLTRCAAHEGWEKLNTTVSKSKRLGAGGTTLETSSPGVGYAIREAGLRPLTSLPSFSEGSFRSLPVDFRVYICFTNSTFRSACLSLTLRMMIGF